VTGGSKLKSVLMFLHIPLCLQPEYWAMELFRLFDVVYCSAQVGHGHYIYSDCPMQNRKGEAARASPWQPVRGNRAAFF
jgi:hypothetical protein